MIFGNCINESTYIISEETLIDNLINESIDMNYQIVKNYIDVIWESRLECINESVMDKVKTILKWIKKGIMKLKDMFIGFLKETTAVIGSMLMLIPPLFKYSFPYMGSFKILVSGVDKMLNKVPKSIMGDIYKYYNSDIKDLSKTLYGDDKSNIDNDKIDVERIKEKYKKMALDIIKPFQKNLTSVDNINIYDMVNTTPEQEVAIGVYIGELKLRILDIEKKIKNTNKLGEELCNSYNSDIEKIDNMISKDADKNADKRQVTKEALILDIVKAEYIGLIYTASLVGKTQFNALNYVLRSYKDKLDMIMKSIRSDDFKSFKNYKDASKKRQEERKKY